MISTGFVGEDSKVLLLRTDIASEDVTDVLKKAGVAFADIPVYRTELIDYEDEDAEDREPVDVITFTSKSCVEGYVQNRRIAGEGATGDDKTDVKALCIGEKTAQAAREQGFDVVVSDEATIDSMLEKAVVMAIDKSGGTIWK